MAINDEELKTTLENLETALGNKTAEIYEIRDVMKALAGIRKKSDGTLPIDNGTGEIVTEPRRQVVWDKCKPHADSIS
jgi:recombination DNA repair RAD52 pathway protein